MLVEELVKNLNPETFSKWYWEHTQTTFKGLNLIGFESFKEFFIKQTEDSLALLKAPLFQQLEYLPLVDLGTGGGLPLLPLVLFSPSTPCFLGIDARNKRISAVNFLLNELKQHKILLKRGKACHLRIENLFFDIPCLVTVKAVSSIQSLLQSLTLSLPLNQSLTVCFYKGPSWKELEFLNQKTFCVGKWIFKEEFSYTLRENLGTRHLVFYQSQGNVPCRTKKNKKDFVKLSSLLLS